MNYFRLHWFDAGMVLFFIVVADVFVFHPTGITLLLWISLGSLFLHQFEEYRFPGYFPGMINKVLFASKTPDRYPLNTNSALLINVGIAWLFYFLAAIFNEHYIWLGIATILVSVGNFFAHTFLFNIKGKTLYNPGMVTAILLFLPISVYFFITLMQNNTVTTFDWTIGIMLGIVLNFVGILKMIDWLKDKNTHYIFPHRFVNTHKL